MDTKQTRSMLWSMKDQLEIIGSLYETSKNEKKRMAELLSMMKGLSDVFRGVRSMYMDVPESERDMESLALLMTVQMTIDTLGVQIFDASKPYIEESKKASTTADPVGAILAALASKAGLDIKLMEVPEEVFRAAEKAAVDGELDCNNPECPTHGDAVKKRVEGKNN